MMKGLKYGPNCRRCANIGNVTNVRGIPYLQSQNTPGNLLTPAFKCSTAIRGAVGKRGASMLVFGNMPINSLGAREGAPDGGTRMPPRNVF